MWYCRRNLRTTPLAARRKTSMKRKRKVCSDDSSSLSVSPNCFCNEWSGIERSVTSMRRMMVTAPQKKEISTVSLRRISKLSAVLSSSLSARCLSFLLVKWQA